jgi:hypothetical protein
LRDGGGSTQQEQEHKPTKIAAAVEACCFVRHMLGHTDICVSDEITKSGKVIQPTKTTTTKTAAPQRTVDRPSQIKVVATKQAEEEPNEEDNSYVF